ncbi:MAG: DUF3368 domain-containing protein [Lachnospiraceae bacterium]|nr:DUF3368 domain-containing protein [Lachnospiraceae bacterium]
MPKLVIVNSTPLIALASIGELDILKSVYGQITIPVAVFNEVTVKNGKVADAIKSADWISVKEVQDSESKKMYKAKLHAGEVEVMILAQEMDADVVIIDDNAAKKTAEYLGLNAVGTMAVLLKAKEIGSITEVSSFIGKIVADGFFISSEVIKIVKDLAGE